MKVRVRRDMCNDTSKYYPQYKNYWWSFWSYIRVHVGHGADDRMCYDDMQEAIDYAKLYHSAIGKKCMTVYIKANQFDRI